MSRKVVLEEQLKEQVEAAKRLQLIAGILHESPDAPIRRAARFMVDPTGLPAETQFALVLMMDAVLGRGTVGD